MFYHEYSLTACGPLNARAAEVCRKGALIKTDEGGYGCIQPWPELGDATLQEELDALRKGRPLPLGVRAAECARTDGEARARGVSLFDGLHIPESHATLPSCVSPDRTDQSRKSALLTGPAMVPGVFISMGTAVPMTVFRRA